MMIKIAKIILMTQAVVCVMIPVFLFNLPLESSRIAHEAQGLAAKLAAGEAGNAIMVAQANEIAAYLSAWRNILPIGTVVLPIFGALVSIMGWQALTHRDKSQGVRLTSSLSATTHMLAVAQEQRYAQKKTRLFAGIGAVTIAAGVIVALPYARKEIQRREGQRIAAEQHDATWRELSWGPDGPSFTVLGFIEVPEPDRNRPVIQLVCRWHTAPSPWDRYEFSFPGAQITYPDGMPAFPMTSPMTENGFVIHYFFIQYPSRMTPLTIPISLKDRKTNTDLGVQLLAFKYWPDKEGLMLALFDKDASTKSPSRRR